MKRMKQVLSWLLVLVMMIGLMPVNLARAEGEEQTEQTVYSIRVSSSVWYEGISPSEEYSAGFSVTVEDGQTGVVKDEDNEDNTEYAEYWDVTAGNSITLTVTTPEDCNTDYLSIKNYNETMDGVVFQAVEGEENTYSVTITPTENMHLEVYDGTYYSAYVDCVASNFDCYITNSVDSTEGISEVRRGESYVIRFKNLTESASADNLNISINDVSLAVADLVEDEMGWTYTIDNVNGHYNVTVYEEGTKLFVYMPDVSAYGYAIYDQDGNNKIGAEIGWRYEVANGDSLTFKMVQEGEVTDSSPFGLYVNGKELVPVDGIYTIPNVTWTTDVRALKKYTISVNEESTVKLIPCDENGQALTDSSVSSYMAPDGWLTYFKLDTDNYRDYVVTYNSSEISVGENGVYQVWIDGAAVTITLVERPKQTVSMTGAKFIPCTSDGEELVDDAVTEYRFRSNEIAYFKLDVDGQRCQVLDGENELGTDENGIYSVEVGESDLKLTANLLYEVLYKDGLGYYIYMGSETESYDWGDMVGDYNCVYAPSEFIFSVGIPEDWNAENMAVALKDAEGNLIESTPTQLDEPQLNEWNELQYNYTATTTENVTIVVTGLYEESESTFVLSYNEEKFSDITMKILDESGEVVPWLEYWDTTGEKATDIYRGKTYTLVLSGDEETLKKIRMNSEGEELTGAIANGEMKVDITGVTSVSMALEGEYYVNYDDSADDTYSLTIREYRADDLEEIKTVSGYYPGTLSFWIDSNDSNVSAENAYVVSVVDSTGAKITPTTTENVTVDNVGTKRTVYTVNFTSDITIQCAGGVYNKYDVRLPIPATDDYAISSLYYMGDAWDDNGNWYGEPVEYTGVANETESYTTFANIKAGDYVLFDVIADASKDTPYVQLEYTMDGVTHTDYPSLDCEPETLDDGTIKYTYGFYVNGPTDVTVSVETAEITVEAVGGDEDSQYYTQYSEDNQMWYVYDGDPEMGVASVVLEIYDLPRIIDASDTEKKYHISYYINDDSLMLDEENVDTFFTAVNADGTEQNLSLNIPESGFYYEYYEMPIQDGYYKLVVDMSLIEPLNGKVSLRSYRDDVDIEIVGTEGTDYITLENQEFDYKVQNQTLTFKVTATGETFPEDVFVYLGGYDLVDESADGLTRTYTLSNVTHNNVISVSYPATVAFEESEYGWIDIENYGQGAEWDENDNLISYGTYGSGDACYLILGVEEGYDVDSVKVIQKYLDEEGNEQTTTYTQLLPYQADDLRSCYVVLAAGKNTFSISEPKKITYTMSMPTSAAYTIEYVNGSTTTVDYNDSFSFKLKANTGYDLSGVTVTANGKKMTPDANGVYTVTNVKENYTIAVTGFATSKYVVTFKDYDGKVLKTQTVDYGKAATAPANPTRTGYTFAGWDTTFAKVTKDMTVTATYKPILVTKLKITGDYKNLAVNKTMKLTATATPATALNTDVVWTTSNKKWATVSASGKVKALKKGAGKTVTITATAKDGSGVKATYKIKIYKNAVKKIKLSAKTKTVKAGKKVTIKAKFTPSKSICKTLKWTSSNKKWATVNSKGVVTTKKAGKGKTVKITAQAMDGSKKKATIKIKIKK